MGVLSASVSIAKNEQERDALQGWYWYDWANQTFALTVLTVVVPAFIWPIIYSISANLYNSRVAVFTIMIVILAGTALLTRVDLEEGAATAAAIDREAWESSE